ncbi:MAG: hypothetical protein NC320_00475 [Clostridium sp.]|nr:hypothetical protein [Clostridium sp.]MCM1546818.1 hypothetical protein [Ruminococcus sp.]
MNVVSNLRDFLIEAVVSIIFYGIVFGIPLKLLGANIFTLITKEKIPVKVIHYVTMILGGTVLFYIFARFIEKPDYDSNYAYGLVIEMILDDGHHALLHHGHLESALFPVAIGVVSQLLLIAWDGLKPPLLSSLMMGSIYLSDILIIFMDIQFYKFSSYKIGIYLLSVLSLSHIVIGLAIGKREISTFITNYQEKKIVPKNKWTEPFYKLLIKTSCGGFFSLLALLPAAIIIYIMLLIAGQGPDGFIKAFTETSDWTFSQHVAPPIEYDGGHYLCTVAAEGHKKLVKPLRNGVRHGRQIKVNRQLCIANAFEDLIAEKTPRFHKAVRSFYDKHGYPLSKKITTTLRADIVYIVMKPPEWIFAAVLYLFDKDPENRIEIQYTDYKTKGVLINGEKIGQK